MKEFIIDPITAKITPVNKNAALAVYKDADTSGARFSLTGDIVKRLTGFDAHVVYRHDGQDEHIKYDATDVAVDGDTLTFSWILDEAATSNTGNISFSCGFTKGDQKWNTTIFTDKILESLEM